MGRVRPAGVAIGRRRGAGADRGRRLSAADAHGGWRRGRSREPLLLAGRRPAHRGTRVGRGGDAVGMAAGAPRPRGAAAAVAAAPGLRPAGGRGVRCRECARGFVRVSVRAHANRRDRATLARPDVAARPARPSGGSQLRVLRRRSRHRPWRVVFGISDRRPAAARARIPDAPAVAARSRARRALGNGAVPVRAPRLRGDAGAGGGGAVHTGARHAADVGELHESRARAPAGGGDAGDARRMGAGRGHLAATAARGGHGTGARSHGHHSSPRRRRRRGGGRRIPTHRRRPPAPPVARSRPAGAVRCRGGGAAALCQLGNDGRRAPLRVRRVGGTRPSIPASTSIRAASRTPRCWPWRARPNMRAS